LVVAEVVALATLPEVEDLGADQAPSVCKITDRVNQPPILVQGQQVRASKVAQTPERVGITRAVVAAVPLKQDSTGSPMVATVETA
jgi:hypothetical protein